MSIKSNMVALFAAVALACAIYALVPKDAGPIAPPEIGTPVAITQESLSELPSAPVRELERQAATSPTTAHLAREFSSPPQDGPMLAVTVITSSGQPAAGASVWIGESPDPVDRVWETNPKGIAVIPLPATDVALISSSTSTLYGQSPIFPKQAGGEAQVVLFPDADVTVLMVDQSGEPLPDVPVSMGGRQFDQGQYALTDSAGLARLRHVLDHFKFARDSTEFTVGPALLVPQRVGVTIQRADIPDHPVRIVLPPTGSLRISVHHEGGALNTSASFVDLMADPNPGEDRSVSELGALTKTRGSSAMRVKLTQGVADVPYIGLGLDLLAESKDAEPTRSTFGFGPGPRTTGASTPLSLSPLDVAPKLVGLAQTASGEALGSRKVTAKLILMAGSDWEAVSIEVSTTDSGRYEITVPRALSTQWSSLHDRSMSLTMEGPGPFELRVAEPPLPARLLGACRA